MSESIRTRDRALSHKEYLSSLHRPSEADIARISEIQRRKESEIDLKYHTLEERDAATKIQKAYRGHKARRQLNGLTLDPSERWIETIRELRYRSATVPHYGSGSIGLSHNGRVRAPSDVAKLNWQRIGMIAEHAVAGDALSPSREPHAFLAGMEGDDSLPSKEIRENLTMDMRYFLEMVDQKHRYGSNLQVYHEEWLRSKTPQNFFYWLDFGEGRHMDLPGCTRTKLDKEQIRYLTKEERRDYLVIVDDAGKLRWAKNDELITTSVKRFRDSIHGIVAKDDPDNPSFNDEAIARQLSADRHAVSLMFQDNEDDPYSSDGDLVASSDEGMGTSHLKPGTQDCRKKKKLAKHFRVSPATILNHMLRATIKPGTWIYVADTMGRLYVGIKSSGAFQHASFLSGARISSAGAISIENGQLTYLSPLSGHYRPTTKSFKSFISSLRDQGVDMSQLRVSKALDILLGMEYYGRTKKSVSKVVHPDKDGSAKRQKNPDPSEKFHLAIEGLSATDRVEQSWRQEHRGGMRKLMSELGIRRKTPEGEGDG